MTQNHQTILLCYLSETYTTPSIAFPLSSLFTIIILILTSLVLADTKHDYKNTSPFDFLKNLQGCHKGQNVQGIQDLKKYLQHFGYLNYQKQSLVNIFDDELESAIKTYQLNYHLNPTGILDSETVSQMRRPRCGVADIINGKTRMNSSKLHIVSHYAFFPGNAKWPANKYHLRYAFRHGTGEDAVGAVKRAFKTWEVNTQLFSFEMIEYYLNSDIIVGFYRGEHGDGAAFDGPGGSVAHAFVPPYGMFHYDADEIWSVEAKEGAMHLESVALHEIGHLLGLAHSYVEDAVMFPTILPGQIKGLKDDDIQGIKALYNL
ncbi:metalloendoproteinase 3-MMP-like [Euphorbia lathyris]|uniref:metalloendoproteinase 3-MMP-like n=1 Tax=Euphorbia lathyris TaxID=212925 RepID=UPI0033130A98